ncbi:protein lifeguard 1-like isoform X2 [Tubulanus polymorphus]|uniref:protein lifeguard 1-like isoform X2 n=1 Tax=Tubulanus polymorphus TaxID=672921 RepID=UPI003DA241F2
MNVQIFPQTDNEIKSFIRKVYSILTIQLLVTISIMCCFIFIEPVKQWAFENNWVWLVAFGVTIICLIVLACCADVRRKFPMNIIFLGIFTLCEGILLGTVSCRYKTDAVLMAAGITTVVAVGLTIFSFQTKWDFTMCSGALFVLTIVLLVFGIICLIVRNRYASIAYASLGALIFAMYLVMDTQMMIGGKHKYALSPEEYIFAALNLYLDIVNMFMFILSIIGLSGGN